MVEATVWLPSKRSLQGKTLQDRHSLGKVRLTLGHSATQRLWSLRKCKESAAIRVITHEMKKWTPLVKSTFRVYKMAAATSFIRICPSQVASRCKMDLHTRQHNRISKLCQRVCIRLTKEANTTSSHPWSCLTCTISHQSSKTNKISSCKLKKPRMMKWLLRHLLGQRLFSLAPRLSPGTPTLQQ